MRPSPSPSQDIPPRQSSLLRDFFLWSPTLAEAGQGRDNNFNLIRFLAASMVILHHAETEPPRTPVLIDLVEWLTRSRESTGSLPVLVFFAISGFLVTRSFMGRGTNLLTFMSARVLRIFPALWVAIPFTIIVASFASAMPWGKYLTHHQTIKYWWHNSLLWNLEYNLPGAFLHVPKAGNVNGSLWTLPAEFRMYVICAALGLAGLYAIRPVFNAFLLSVLILGLATKYDTLPFIDNISVAQWQLAFLLGTALYVNRNEIRLNIPVAVALLWAMRLIEAPDLGRLYVIPAIAYATLCFSLHPAVFFRPFTRLGDYSYGLYIYAFPLQQLILFYHPDWSWPGRLALAYPIILSVAVLSWHFIEEPALRLKKYFRSQPPAALTELPVAS